MRFAKAAIPLIYVYANAHARLWKATSLVSLTQTNCFECIRIYTVHFVSPVGRPCESVRPRTTWGLKRITELSTLAYSNYFNYQVQREHSHRAEPDLFLYRLSDTKSSAVPVIADRTAYNALYTAADCCLKWPWSAWLIYLFTVSKSVFDACQLVSEEVNRKGPPKNKMVQLSTLYTDPERHNAQRHGQTDRQTDDNIVPMVDHTATACSNTIG